ncbi:MAG: CocE/NonD family hydrolase [Thermoplasmatota archaeon]
MRASLVLPALLMLLAAGFQMVPAAADGPADAWWTEGRNDFFVEMPDGTLLDALMIVPNGTQPGDELPALVAIHGYGGSKDDDTAQLAADNGYVGFAYTTRGFGQSTGLMDVVGPASQQDLVDIVAWLKANGPVVEDAVGVVGASYGGAHSFWAAARPDSGVAAAAPVVGWTDLELALRPNDVFKLSYAMGFYVSGHGLAQSGDDPIEMELFGENIGRRCFCETYDPAVHAALAHQLAGIDSPWMEQIWAERSVRDLAHQITIPTFIIQGLNDDLFPGDQVLEFFEAIPTEHKRLHLGYAGHPRAVQEGPEVDFLYDEIIAFFDHYLKGAGPSPIDPANPITVSSRPWDGTSFALADWPDDAGPALSLGADGSLGAAAGADGVVALVPTHVAGIPDDGAATLLFPELSYFPAGTPVDTVSFSTGPLTEATKLLGTPTADLVMTPLGAHVQVAVKVFDVAPDGSADLVTKGILGLRDRLPGVALPTTFDLQPYHHTFAAGNSIEVRVAAGDFPSFQGYPSQSGFVLHMGADGSTVSLPLAPA